MHVVSNFRDNIDERYIFHVIYNTFIRKFKSNEVEYSYYDIIIGDEAYGSRNRRF
jgi:hypothetical protein